MIQLISSIFDLRDCQASLEELGKLLREKPSLGERELHKFFTERPNLILLLGYWHFGLEPAFYKSEANIFNEFRADFMIADRDRKKCVFVEFEDATENSIFTPKSGRGNISYEWSSRYEHGVSQVTDWYYRLDDYERTNKFEEYFSSPDVDYTGLLVIGRDHFLEQVGLKKRFRWRARKTIINSRQLHCITFDQLLAESIEKLSTLQSINQL